MLVPAIFQSFYYNYGRLPITQTFKGNRKTFELLGVPVIASLKQITGSKEISKWMGGEAIKQQSTKREWKKWQKSKDKEFTWDGCFEINSMFRTSVRGFFPSCQVLITWFKLLRVKLYWNQLKGNKNYFELAGGSSYRGFE